MYTSIYESRWRFKTRKALVSRKVLYLWKWFSVTENLWLIFEIEPNLCVLSDHPLHKLIQSQHDLKPTVATPQNHRCSNIVKRVPFPCPVWERWHGSPNRTVGISPRHAVDIAFECYLRSCACVSCAADKCVRSIWNRSNEFFSICGFPIRSA